MNPLNMQSAPRIHEVLTPALDFSSPTFNFSFIPTSYVMLISSVDFHGHSSKEAALTNFLPFYESYFIILCAFNSIELSLAFIVQRLMSEASLH